MVVYHHPGELENQATLPTEDLLSQPNEKPESQAASQQVRMKHKTELRLFGRTGLIEHKLRDDDGNFIMVPATPPDSNQDPVSPPNIKSKKRKVTLNTITQVDEDTSVQQQSSKTATSETKNRPRKAPKRKSAKITKADDDLTDTEDEDTVLEKDDDEYKAKDDQSEDDDDDDVNNQKKKAASSKKKKYPITVVPIAATEILERKRRRTTKPSSTPVRVSARIKSMNINSPPFVISGPRRVSAANRPRNPRDPKNHAIGFSAPKQPKTLTADRKKELQKIQEKKDNLNARIAYYDKIHNAHSDGDDEDDNLLHLFPNDEWYFLDKQLLEHEEAVKSKSADERHRPGIYKPLLYKPFQRSKKKAEDIVEKLIQPKLDQAIEDLADIDKKLKKLLEKYGNRKNKQVENAREEWVTATVKKQMLEWEITGQKLLLPYDSIFAIQVLPSKYIKGEYDYFAVTDNPDGEGWVKKWVSKAWLDENVDQEFMKKVSTWNNNTGWVAFSNALDEFKVIPGQNDLSDALYQHILEPIYEYEPLRNDDEILIVRCEVIYDRYSEFVHVKNMRWTVLTKKESFSLKPTILANLPDDPLAKDEDGDRLYDSIYNNISKEMLCSIIGCELVFLLETASVLCGQQERNTPFALTNAPEFKFANDFEATNTLVASKEKPKKVKSTVALHKTKTRFYDERDMLSDGVRHRMPLQLVGDMSQPQFYYYDMREFTKRYYVHCNKTQISGLYFDEGKNKFFGLCKKENAEQVAFLHHIELEDDWVEHNFHEEFIELVKEKSRKDQRKFIKLPIGKAKPLSSPECNRSNPVIKFLQNGKDNCVFTSMASVLSYMGFETLAEFVMQYEKEFVKTQYTNDIYSAVMGLTNHKIVSFKQKDFNRKYQLCRIRNHEEFDLIETATKNPNILYHVVLEGSDGSENHCVCVFNNFIFDANYTHAWKLEQSSLDECIDCTFIGINDGYMYIPRM